MRYEDVVLADNPIAYWPLTELSGTTATALVGSSATWAGTPAVGAHRFPAGGRMPNLDRSNDCAQASSLNLTAYSSVVVECWWRPTTYASLQILVETSADYGANNGALAVYASNATTMTIATAQAGFLKAGEVSPRALGRLSHFVFEINRATSPASWLTLINGRRETLSAVFNDTTSGNFGTFALNMGARNNGALYPAGGAFGHVAIYSSLSAGRALAHYRAGLARPTRLPFRTRAA